MKGSEPVSYTHLDVYKRQLMSLNDGYIGSHTITFGGTGPHFEDDSLAAIVLELYILR